MVEEDLKSNIILDSGSQIDIFENPQLVIDIKRRNQVLHLSTSLVSKTNQMQAMVPDYGKVWYVDKATVNILSLNKLDKK